MHDIENTVNLLRRARVAVGVVGREAGVYEWR